MIVEAYNPFIENMLQSEPWRGSEGRGPLCDGRIEWDGTRHWLCTGCGKIGTLQVQTHRSIVGPGRTLLNAIKRRTPRSAP